MQALTSCITIVVMGIRMKNDQYNPYQHDATEQTKTPAQDTGSKVVLTTSSACLLLATVAAMGIYWYIFGFHMIGGDTPDHWSWLGGFVGLFAVAIRVVVILVLAIPYVTISVMGMVMSIRAFRESQGVVAWLNGALAAGHGIMLIPAAYIVILCLLEKTF